MMKPALPSSTPSISIALAAYNGERYLREQLESLAAQSVLPLELVVCDDGSSDRTIAIVNSCTAAAPFPVVVHENSERLGYAGNFLEAARRCQGEVIAFCDQDDVWRRDKLERCGAEFLRAEVGVVVHSAQEVDEELTPCNLRLPDIRRNEVLGRGSIHSRVDCPPGCAMLVRRAIMQEVLRLWPGKNSSPDGPQPKLRHLLAHDCATYFVARSLAAVAYVEAPLIYHRRHTRNITGPKSSLKDYLQAVVRTGAHAYRRNAEHAGAASELYSFMAAGAGDSELERQLRQVASRFERRAGSLVARADLYSAGSHYQRLKAIARMIRAGVYGGVGQGGVGSKAIGKDLLWAVLGPASGA
jgi:glycosyltransferase involved in cell wall biosynthesis